jgi:SrtB family sortase
MAVALAVTVFGLLMYFWTDQGVFEKDTEEISLVRAAAEKGNYQWLEKQVGWIKMFDTHINYPIMQGGDNQWFLTHDFLNRDEVSGAIFLDYRNRSDFSDDVSVIYGHRMNGSLMFSDVAKYKDSDYFDKHRRGELVSRDGSVYELEALVFRQIDADDELYSELELDDFDEPVVVLSTCDRTEHEKRDILILKLL